MRTEPSQWERSHVTIRHGSPSTASSLCVVVCRASCGSECWPSTPLCTSLSPSAETLRNNPRLYNSGSQRDQLHPRPSHRAVSSTIFPSLIYQCYPNQFVFFFPNRQTSLATAVGSSVCRRSIILCKRVCAYVECVCVCVWGVTFATKLGSRAVCSVGGLLRYWLTRSWINTEPSIFFVSFSSSRLGQATTLCLLSLLLLSSIGNSLSPENAATTTIAKRNITTADRWFYFGPHPFRTRPAGHHKVFVTFLLLHQVYVKLLEVSTASKVSTFA